MTVCAPDQAHSEVHTLYLTANSLKYDSSSKTTSGYNHVCLTDHNVMYGTMEFYQLCKKHNVHPIIGLEVDSIYNEESFHFILLAKNDMGLQNLYKLSSIIKMKWSFEEAGKVCQRLCGINFQRRKDTFSGIYWTSRFRKVMHLSNCVKNLFQISIFLYLWMIRVKKELIIEF